MTEKVCKRCRLLDLSGVFEAQETEKELAIIEGFRKVINENSFENHSDTPDFILTEVAYFAMLYHSRATVRRSKWHGIINNNDENYWVDDDKRRARNERRINGTTQNHVRESENAVGITAHGPGI